jgi:hypothetical protein
VYVIVAVRGPEQSSDSQQQCRCGCHAAAIETGFCVPQLACLLQQALLAQWSCCCLSVACIKAWQ